MVKRPIARTPWSETAVESTSKCVNFERGARAGNVELQRFEKLASRCSKFVRPASSCHER